MKEHPLFYEASRVPLSLFTHFVARLEVRGLEHIPARGPAILCSNHVAWMDILAIAVECPRPQHHMGKIELFSVPVLGWYIRALGAFPVRRGESDRESLRMAEEVLAAGQVVVVFPEGHRSGTGRLAAGHPGVALIALRTGAPIVPVGISGTEHIFRDRRYGPWAPPVRVVYGEPFELKAAGPRRTRAELEAGMATIMGRIAALLPPAYRGAYADAVARELAPGAGAAAQAALDAVGPAAPAGGESQTDVGAPPAGA
jgi:1-acyl-sn-glycerol-3-phosphate acyltransferase